MLVYYQCIKNQGSKFIQITKWKLKDKHNVFKVYPGTRGLKS